MSDRPSNGDDQFVLRVLSERRTVYHFVGISAKSVDTARQRFNENWSGFEVEVRIPHHNGNKWETVFAPTEQSAGVVATSRSGEYSDVPGKIQDLDIDVEVIEAIPKDDIETLKQERALDELSRIQYEADQ